MLTFKFALLTVLSYVVMIGATPLRDLAPSEAIDHRQAYVPLTTSRGCSDPIENVFPAPTWS